MDSLNDILSRKNLDEPSEITAIKSYVRRQFKESVKVALKPSGIVITSASAALANTLQMQSPKLQKIAGTDKKLIFRIGS